MLKEFTMVGLDHLNVIGINFEDLKQPHIVALIGYGNFAIAVALMAPMQIVLGMAIINSDQKHRHTTTDRYVVGIWDLFIISIAVIFLPRQAFDVL